MIRHYAARCFNRVHGLYVRTRRLKLPRGSRPCLNYASMLSVSRKRPTGGRLKFIHLAQMYPEKPGLANIMYMISSAKPRNAAVWAELARQRGIKLVWNQNGVAYPAWAGLDYERINEPMKTVLHKADHVIYQSNFCKTCADKYLGVFDGPSSVIYNCVDCDIFKPAQKPPPMESLRLIVMGTHSHAYRVIEAVKVVNLLRNRFDIDARLTVAGRFLWPKGREEIDQVCSSLDVKTSVHVTGSYTQSQAVELLQQSHVLLHLQYNDASPTTVIESMACGIPVVASGSGGVPEILGKDGGAAVPVPLDWEERHIPSHEETAARVVNILKDWHTWSSRARKKAVNHFSKPAWMEAHQNLFMDVLK